MKYTFLYELLHWHYKMPYSDFENDIENRQLISMKVAEILDLADYLKIEATSFFTTIYNHL